MKRNRSHHLHTPIKKWQQMSPMQQEDLVIVESDISQCEQPELFLSLAGPNPHQHTPHPSSPSLFEEYSDQESSFPFSIENSEEEEIPNTVSQMKIEESSIQSRVPFRPIDSNRKGCNCRQSKCEKGYCDCLKIGLVCQPGLCSCDDCHNTEEKDIHRQIIKKLELPEVTSKGCRCKKSRCLKKYCECHSGGRTCSPLCECVGCSNRDENLPPEGTDEMLKRLRRVRQDRSEFLIE